MLRLITVVLLCSSCATTEKPATPPRTESCQRNYDLCNNACFKAPNYKRDREHCSYVAQFQVCPQENQLIDTVEAGKCFDKCEWNVKLCR